MRFALTCHAVFAAVVAPAFAQCGPGWLPRDDRLSPNGWVSSSVMWDRDGAGAEPARLVIGGYFTMIGNITARYVAIWNPETNSWSGTAGNLFGNVQALCTHPDGQGGRLLVAADSHGRVGTWNGTQWSWLGTRFDGGINAIISYPNDGGGHDLIVGGRFTRYLSSTTRHLARWQSPNWVEFGGGSNREVYAFATLPGPGLIPDLIVGGDMYQTGGVNVEYVARWRSGAWSPMGSNLDNRVCTLVTSVHPSGNVTLYAGGAFYPGNVARWTGTTWSVLGTGTNSTVNSLIAMPNASGGDDIIAGGYFTSAGSHSAIGVARWDGAAWNSYGSGVNGYISTLIKWPDSAGNLHLVAGGQFPANGYGPYWAVWSETGAPWVAVQPQSQTIQTNTTLTLFAMPADGFENVSYQWRRNGLAISNGQGGAAANGGYVTGAFGTLPSPTDDLPVTLTIQDARPFDTGEYTVEFFNPCGSGISVPAPIFVHNPCRADFDGDGFLTGLDFDMFVYAFEDGSETTDMNDDGFVNGIDYDVYVYFYRQGC